MTTRLPPPNKTCREGYPTATARPFPAFLVTLLLMFVWGVAHLPGQDTDPLKSDTVILKSGQQIKGTILEETAEGVKIRYRPFPNITDETVFKSEDIAEIKKERPDEIALREIGEVLPTKDLMTSAEYGALINDELGRFLKEFPESPLRAEVEAMVSTLEEEKSKVDDGFKKVDGRWLTAEEFETNRYNIEATIQFRQLQALAEAGENFEALRLFEKLESGHGDSLAYPRAVTYLKDVLQAYRKDLNGRQAELPQLIADRDRMTGLDEAAKARKLDAIAKEKAEWAALRKKEEATKLRWRSVYPYSTEDIKKALAAVTREQARLRQINVTRLSRVADTTANGLRELGEGNYSVAVAFLETAKQQGGESAFIEQSLTKARELAAAKVAADTERKRLEEEQERQARREAIAAQEAEALKAAEEERPTPPGGAGAPSEDDPLSPEAPGTETDEAGARKTGLPLRVIMLGCIVLAVVGIIAGVAVGKSKKMGP